MLRLFMLFLVLLSITTAQAFELVSQKVTDNVYALVGEVGPRSKENLALNNTLGFVITNKGVLLVGTGATEAAAVLIESTIKKTTDKPISQIINIGSQDHHWMGNSYFENKGIPVTALRRTSETQSEHIPDHLARLDKLKLVHLTADKVKLANKLIDADEYTFKLGETNFKLRYIGDSHFPNDAVLWLPNEKVIFTGDLVFNDRILGVQPHSKTKQWAETFNKMAAMKPEFVIPGHGKAGPLAKAQKDTGDYINWLVNEVSKAQENWEDIGDMVARLKETNKFNHLKFHETWNPINLNRTYLQIEAE